MFLGSKVRQVRRADKSLTYSLNELEIRTNFNLRINHELVLHFLPVQTVRGEKTDYGVN
jgi:hypothetical protein